MATRPPTPDQADRHWFRAHPSENFRTRPAYPGEFSLAELKRRPDRGEPVVFVVATRDPHGRVQRVVRMLRFRLPARERVA
jgi:hypothetical protein